ncbi:MAG: hypothetical protein RMJ00_07235 [Nitrososphaerota archaeon]|nr:hypothetical protein [Nitrososphaerota archaeon]
MYRETPHTDEKYGCRPDRRPIDKLLEYGLIILDKPSGPTSHDVTALIKRIVEARKAGHGGTLEA